MARHGPAELARGATGRRSPDDPGRATHWAPATRRNRAWSYGRYLGWMERCGELDPAGSAATLVTEARVKAHVAIARARSAPLTVLSIIADLRLFARAVAPEVDWAWFGRMEAAARQRAKPVRDQRARLRLVRELVDLGEALMAAADGGELTPLQQLLAYRDGLMIALLALAPLRLGNFAALRLDHSLVRLNGATWWITVPASETKGHRRPFERPFPERLEIGLRRYLDEIRPALAQRRGRWACPIGPALWVSSHGSPMTAAAVYQQIVGRTATAFGIPVNPHLFRHSAATSLALASPEDVRAGALMLGHASYATTERHYNLARAFDAARRYHEVLDAK